MTVQFRGREVSHAYLGRDLLTRFAEQVGEHGTVERQPLLEGKPMSMVMTSTHKPKVLEPQPDRRHEQTNGAAAEPAPAAERRSRRQRQCQQRPKPTAAEAKAVEPTLPEAEQPTRRHQPKQQPKPSTGRSRSDAAEEPKKKPATRTRAKVAASGAGKPAAAS